MASIVIDEVPELLVLSEVRQAMYIAMEVLNGKRRLHNSEGFADARVSEIIPHPIFRRPSFVVEFGDNDRAAPRYVAQELKNLAVLSRERRARIAEVARRAEVRRVRYSCCS